MTSSLMSVFATRSASADVVTCSPKTGPVKDRLIREELRSKDYEVIETMYQQLFDKVMMRQHMRRIARAIFGREKAKTIEEDDSWFGLPSGSTGAPPHRS